MESWWIQRGGKALDLSEQQILDCGITYTSNDYDYTEGAALVAARPQSCVSCSLHFVIYARFLQLDVICYEATASLWVPYSML